MRKPHNSVPSKGVAAPYQPARPHLAALGLSTVWIALLSLPMWTGQLLAGPYSDQYPSGYAIRRWAAEQWLSTGKFPLWNPEIFGGIPVFAGFGDIFYPTAWLRLVLPTTTAMNLGFVVHYVLAAFLLYLLLRMLGVSWLGSVVGGTAYQLSGVIVSYVSPGHDGKLFVTALLPLMLIGLVMALRRRRHEGYALLGLTVGLSLLSPQYQMTQYALVVAGLFALYLAMGEPDSPKGRARWMGLGLALLAIVLGFGISMIQVLPFFRYIPLSPRAEAGGYAWATSYAIPWIHVPEFFISSFVGSGFTGTPDTYWGPNPLKLHSEYLGLPVIALAVLGATGPRTRLVRWLLGIGLLFLLVSLGSGTPFYRIWYALVPYVNKTRAPGMALYVVSLVLAALAAFGTERLERREGGRWFAACLGAAAAIALLALGGAFGGLADWYVRNGLDFRGVALPPLSPEDRDAIRWGALGSATALAALAGLGFGFTRGALPSRLLAPGLLLFVGGDLWRDGRQFWNWSRPEQGLFAEDAIIRYMKATPLPFRALDPGVYSLGGAPQNVLAAHGIPQVLGYHSNEIRTYDELLGRNEGWANLSRSLNLWNLLGVRFLVVGDSSSVPGYHRVQGPIATASGQSGVLYEADVPPPYARVVPAAAKAEAGRVVPTLIDPRLDIDRVVLFDQSQLIDLEDLTTIPGPSPSRANVTAWQAGRMSLRLQPAPPAASYVVVAENWYPDWKAEVDGRPVTVLRGDHTLITVPVPAGATSVELTYQSTDYEIGRAIAFVSLLLLAGWGAAPRVFRRAQPSSG